MSLLDFTRGYGSNNAPNSLDDQLAFVKQYDPNASIQSRDTEQGGGDNGSHTVTNQVLNYDTTKLPKMKEGYIQNLTMDPGYVSSGGEAPRKNADNSHAIWDKDYGYIVPTGDVGDIDEKANNAQQSKEGGWMSKIGNMIVPDDKPWMAIPTAIGLGIGGSALSGMDKAITNFGLNAASTGGKSLSDPMSYLSAGLGMAAPNLPPDVLKTLGYIKTAAGWIKNPIGSAANLAVNKLIGS